MASGFFAILDDIAILLDDAAVMSKVAVKKTATLLGDDLAVNAEKATGFKASQELPVIWAITKGSLVNKLIILPVAFLLSAFLPWLIVPILLIGGAYLSYEGAEKVFDWLLPQEREKPAAEVVTDPSKLVDVEKKKIKGAIRTDFILSIEIIVIALETVIDKPFGIQILVVSFIALLATVGVYGLVALLVRMDDVGFHYIDRSREMKGNLAVFTLRLGRALVAALPKVIQLLSIVGTIAMLLVGGGMFVHNIDKVHQLLHAFPALLAELLAGLVVGTALFTLHLLYNRVLRKAH